MTLKEVIQNEVIARSSLIKPFNESKFYTFEEISKNRKDLLAEKITHKYIKDEFYIFVVGEFED